MVERCETPTYAGSKPAHKEEKAKRVKVCKVKPPKKIRRVYSETTQIKERFAVQYSGENLLQVCEQADMDFLKIGHKTKPFCAYINGRTGLREWDAFRPSDLRRISEVLNVTFTTLDPIENNNLVLFSYETVVDALEKLGVDPQGFVSQNIDEEFILRHDLKDIRWEYVYRRDSDIGPIVAYISRELYFSQVELFSQALGINFY